MQNPVHRGPTVGAFSFLRRHLIAIMLILVAALITAGLIYWKQTTTLAEIATIESKMAQQIATDDKRITEIKIRVAAELKAKQEAAAKVAAEQAKTATESTATSINSSDCNTSKVHNDPAAIDVVVNKKHCVQPVSFEPGDLVDIGGGYLLSQKAATSFRELLNAASNAGISLTVTSTYRSYATQVATYAYWVNTSGKDGADTYSARPGYSEHQTGLAVDVASNGCSLSCFGSSPAYGWMQANAATYGFIQRYHAGHETITGYIAEEWHYRYVGPSVAKDMQTKGIKTLEEYWGIPGGNYF